MTPQQIGFPRDGHPPMHIRRATTTDIESICRVHIDAFPGFFMTLLGRRFLAEYYRTVLAAPKGICLVATDDSHEESQVVGFVAGFVDVAAFYTLMRRRRPQLAISAMTHVITHPWIVLRLLQTVRRVSDEADKGVVTATTAELSSIGVRTSTEGRGIGRQLVVEFVNQAHGQRAESVVLTTDARDNDAVNRFYVKLGFVQQRQFTAPGKRHMNEYRLDLDPEQPWSPEAPLVADSVETPPMTTTQALSPGRPQKPLRALFVTHWYEPEPVIRPGSLARGLADRGHHVEVITGFPNYPTGKVYEGFTIRPQTVERKDNVVVRRMAMFPDRSASAVRRLVSHASLALSSAVVLPFRVPQTDVVWIHSPSPPPALVTVVMTTMFRKPFVYEVQDLWPEAISASGVSTNGAIISAIEQINKRIYKRVDAFVVITQSLKEDLIAKGVPSDRIHVIPNWVEGKYQPTEPDPAIVSELNAGSRLVVLYGGNLGKAQALSNVVNAAALLDDTVRIAMIGTGVEAEQLKAQATKQGVENIVFHGHRPHDDMPKYYAAADALLVHLSPNDEFSRIIPSKLTAYLACGKPIIAVAGGEAARVVRDSGAGLVVKPGDPEALAAGIIQMQNTSSAERVEMGQKAREYYLAFFDRDRSVDQYADLFLSLTKRG